MTRRTNRARAFAPDPAAPGRSCDMPGCPHEGGYKAPKSRTSLREWHWFCLEHVRAYNAAWDYYKGMSPGEIEAHMRADTAWQRPSWPLGRLGGRPAEEAGIADPLDLLARGRRTEPPRQAAPPELRGPLGTLGLAWPVSLDAVKTRYKELAKRHHPDANGGSRAAEERLKAINLAYAALRSHLSLAPGFAAAD